MITKRQLGFTFIVLGLFVFASTFALDLLRTASAVDFEAEIGPMQIAAMIGGGLTTLVGVTLIPLGNRPA